MDNSSLHIDQAKTLTTKVISSDDQPETSATDLARITEAAAVGQSTRAELLRVEHELDSTSAFKLSDMTAIEVAALVKELQGHKDLRTARLRIARAAKIRPHAMEIGCGLLGRKVVLALLAPDNEDPEIFLDKLLPLARTIADEWFTRDERARLNSSPQPTERNLNGRDDETSSAPHQTDPRSGAEANELSTGLQPIAGKVGVTTVPAKSPVGLVMVTYSAGGEPPHHPPLALPPPALRPPASFRLGEERVITCEVLRRTAADRCMLKEVEATRLKEATFGTSGDLETLINLLAGFPPVKLTVQDYLSDQEDVQPPFHFHISSLAALTNEWDQEISLVALLRECVEKIAELLKVLRADRLGK